MPATAATHPPDSPPTRNDPLALLAFLVVTFLACGVGLALGGDPAWYRELALPAVAPPGWVFGPVWTVLYILMAVSVWLVWRRLPPRRAVVPLGLYAAQLILNAAWTGIFFGLRLILPALVEMLVLLVLIIVMAVVFARHSRVAAGLLLPYIGWVGFASYLTLRIWQLNP